MSELSSIGLLYDIAGVVVLGWALALASDAVIEAQAGTYWNHNLPLLDALVTQRIDARFGPILLVAGFLLQLFGTLLLDAPPLFDWIIAALLPTAAFMFLVMRRRLVKLAMGRIRASMDAREREIEAGS